MSNMNSGSERKDHESDAIGDEFNRRLREQWVSPNTVQPAIAKHKEARGNLTQNEGDAFEDGSTFLGAGPNTSSKSNACANVAADNEQSIEACEIKLSQARKQKTERKRQNERERLRAIRSRKKAKQASKKVNAIKSVIRQDEQSGMSFEETTEDNPNGGGGGDVDDVDDDDDDNDDDFNADNADNADDDFIPDDADADADDDDDVDADAVVDEECPDYTRDMFTYKSVDANAILKAEFPTKENVIKCFVNEITHRAAICTKRDDLEKARSLYSKGIECLKQRQPSHFSGNVVEDIELSKLYVLQCYLLVEMNCDDVEVRAAAKEAIRYCPSSPDALGCLAIIHGVLIIDPEFTQIYREVMEEINTENIISNIGHRRGGSTPSDGIGTTEQCDSEDLPGNGAAKKKKVPKKAEEYSIIMRDEEYTWSHLLCFHPNRSCDNCKRMQVTSNPQDPLYFDMYEVWSNSISQVRSPLRAVTATRDRCGKHHLCSECNSFLAKNVDEKNWDWKNVWPSFYWNLLTGSDMRTGTKFHVTYCPEKLWRFIPTYLRKYWVSDSTDDSPLYQACKLYKLNECTRDKPKPYFVDRTTDVCEFWADIKEYSFKGFLRALDPTRVPGCEHKKPMMIPDVLCPWGCCEFSFRMKHLKPTILIQHHLRRVQLNLPAQCVNNLHLGESSRIDYLPLDYLPELESSNNYKFIEDYDVAYKSFVLQNPAWPIRPTTIMVPGIGLMIGVCRHHSSQSTQRRLYTHPPRKPDGMNLSSVRPDQLCQAKIQPRIVKAAVKKGINTVPSLSLFQCSYSGADSANVCFDARFENTGPKRMNFEHEVTSIENRPDLLDFSNVLIREGKMSEDLLAGWLDEAKARSLRINYDLFKRGSTYVPSVNAIQLQKASSEEDMVTVKIKHKTEPTEILVDMKRSWCKHIYCVQTEGDCYGYPIKGIGAMKLYRAEKKRSQMLAWTLVGLATSCKELYHIIDQRVGGHSHDNFSGYLLSSIHHKYMKHCDSANVWKSPFRSNLKEIDLCLVIENSLCTSLCPYEGKYKKSKAEEYYLIKVANFRELFPETKYPRLGIIEDIDEVKCGDVSGKDVLIQITKDRPEMEAFFEVSGQDASSSLKDKFEARVVIALSADKKDASRFDGNRMARHGNGYTEWWQQKRYDKQLMTWYDRNSLRESTTDDPFPLFKKKCLKYIVVWVRNKEFVVEEYKLDMHRSLGGQCSAFCTCNGSENPLIISGTVKEERRCCILPNCRKPERYTCPIRNCDTYICSDCFKSLTAEGKVDVLDHKQQTNDTHHISVSRGNTENVDQTEGEEDLSNPNNESNGIHHPSENSTGTDNEDDEEPDYDFIPDEDELDEELAEYLDSHEYAVINGSQDDDKTGSVKGPCNDTQEENVDVRVEDQNAVFDNGPITADHEWDNSSDTNDPWYICGNESSDDEYEWNSSEIDEEEDYLMSQFINTKHDKDVIPAPPDFFDNDYVEQSHYDDDEVDCLKPRHVQINDATSFLQAGRKDGNHYTNADAVVTTADYDALDGTMIDDINEVSPGVKNHIPRVNGAVQEVTLKDRKSRTDGRIRVPMHVLYNQIGRLCTRHNKVIRGTNVQQNFVQMMVSTIQNYSFPFLYFNGTLFPKHFWSAAKHDKVAILGCLPISCYRKASHPDGFASNLEVARNLCTHAFSSTATDDNFLAHAYDIQANAASCGIDSRAALRHGFTVSTSSPSGLQLSEGSPSQLTECLDSSSAMMGLTALNHKEPTDFFCTLTCSQGDHPGVCHLHKWKESNGWTKMVPGYDTFSRTHRYDVYKSMEMAYSHILTRCWLETRKLLLEFIIHSTSSGLGGVTDAFFRDEYQECSGNLSHIHGLIKLDRNGMNDKEFQEFVCSLQKNCVGDLVQSTEVQDLIDEGLFTNEKDWIKMRTTADKILSHTHHNKRCLLRKDHTGNPEIDFRCRKIHPVFDSKNCFEDEFQDLPYVFSDSSLEILEHLGLYTPPAPGQMKGRFHMDMLQPKRHVGTCHPAARENMSPVLAKFFALTLSMQNAQVTTNSNGVNRYVAKVRSRTRVRLTFSILYILDSPMCYCLPKYIIKVDIGNKCLLFTDAHTGAVMRSEKLFLHNTKISRSAMNEKKAFDQSRYKSHPHGRYMGVPQKLHHLLGDSDVHTTRKFREVSTRAFEYRRTTSIRLDRRGNLSRHDKQDDIPDTVSPVTDSCSIRKTLLPKARRFTTNQCLLLQPAAKSSTSYDEITLFGLRPPEILELFSGVQIYYEWFVTDSKVMKKEDIEKGLNEDVTLCQWIDGLGRRVRLRQQSLSLVAGHLEEIVETNVADHSWKLRCHLLDVIHNKKKDSNFIINDDGEKMPIVVFSRVQPNRSTSFLLHIMLVLGRFETELDFREARTMKESLAKAGLFPSEGLDDQKCLERYRDDLLKRIIFEIIPLQPISMPKIDDFIVKSKQLLDSVLFRDTIPMTDLPPCILTDLLKDKSDELKEVWEERRSLQVDSMLANLNGVEGLPTKATILKATKDRPQKFSPLKLLKKSSDQSDESYEEQRLALTLGVNCVNSYCKQFGPTDYTRGLLANGAPGAGKTFVEQAIGLYGMTRGLRVMSSSLMAVRSTALGGYHLHRLFQWEVGRSGNLFRLAELALEKLHRKGNITFLHIVLTMDMLLLDECGQLSAQQIALIDIILRHARTTSLPFGGVLIIGTFDHAQLGAIQGLPFLLSTHVLTDFTLVRLEHSVRAAKDPILQQIQKITRTSPFVLRKDKKLRKTFKKLVSKNIVFVDSFDDPKVTRTHIRLYHRRLPANAAVENWIDETTKVLTNLDIEYKIAYSRDMKKTSGSLAGFNDTHDERTVKLLNTKTREPRRLLFYRGAVFEATVNTEAYSQSQIVMMLTVPTDDDIRKLKPLTVFAAPPGGRMPASIMAFSDPPSEEDLIANGWNKVIIGKTSDRPVTRGHVTACRNQYTLRHLVSSTVNKQMGNTLLVPCAIEITEKFFPWERGQVVVELSRNQSCDFILIVGKQDAAIKRMYDTLCQITQWTALMEMLVENLSITPKGRRSCAARVIDYGDTFPWRIKDIPLPNSNSGYVYLLMSTRCPEQFYVGTTKNLAVRLNQHNSGHGSQGTANPLYLPWSPVAYMAGLGHMSPNERMSLEREWKRRNQISVRNGRAPNLEQLIENGRIVKAQYEDQPGNTLEINFVVNVRRRFNMESLEEEHGI